MGHLLHHLLKPAPFFLWSLVLAARFVIGELDYLLPHAFAILPNVSDELGLFGCGRFLGGEFGAGGEDLGEGGGFDFFHLFGAILGADELADPAEAAPDGGVEVVLDGVVSSEFGASYLPGSYSAITVHLFPCRLCS